MEPPLPLFRKNKHTLIRVDILHSLDSGFQPDASTGQARMQILHSRHDSVNLMESGPISMYAKGKPLGKHHTRYRAFHRRILVIGTSAPSTSPQAVGSVPAEFLATTASHQPWLGRRCAPLAGEPESPKHAGLASGRS